MIRRSSLVAAMAVATLVACVTPPKTPAAERSAPAPLSNVVRGDYAGSKACEGCHEDLYERWMNAPMHRMTRLESGADIHAPFDGRSLHFKDDTATLETHDGERYVRIRSPRFGDGLYHVTKVIGGRHREDFAGVQVSEPRPDAIVGDPHVEKILPITWMLKRGELRYKGYSVMAAERPGLRAGPVWNKTCVFCHNTVPFLDTMLGALAGPNAGAYQGEIVDALLPPERRRAFVPLDQGALRDAIADEARRIDADADTSGDLPTVAKKAIRTIRRGFDQRHLVEVGIGCEACHGGSLAHVKNPSVKPSYAIESPLLCQETSAKTPEQAKAESMSRACARCHQVLFSRYPFTWEDGTRRHDPGGSNINSGEARDYLLGGCTSEMSCATCHDLHAGAGAMKADFDTRRGDEVCTHCHTRYADAAALAAHSHHRVDGAGARCVSCHLPKKNLSLDNELTRYHRVASPTEKAKVEHDRPLECALCHMDQSVGALVGTMERWWGKSYDREALARSYGSLDQNPILATITRGKPHEQAVAIYLLGETRDRPYAPLVARWITHPIPLVRYYVNDALAKMLGEKSPIDLGRDDDEIRAETAAWLKRFGFDLPDWGAKAKAKEDDAEE